VQNSEMVREAYSLHAEDDDFGQAGALVRNVLTDTDREHLATNIAGHLSEVGSETILSRALMYWSSIDADLARAVTSTLGRSVDAAEQQAASSNGALNNGHGGPTGLATPDPEIAGAN